MTGERVASLYIRISSKIKTIIVPSAGTSESFLIDAQISEVAETVSHLRNT